MNAPKSSALHLLQKCKLLDAEAAGRDGPEDAAAGWTTKLLNDGTSWRCWLSMRGELPQDARDFEPIEESTRVASLTEAGKWFKETADALQEAA